MTKLDTSTTEWNLSPLLAGDDDPKISEYRQIIQAAASAFATRWRDRTDYLEQPAVLKEALGEYEALNRVEGADNEDLYFGLKSTLETNNTEITARLSKTEDFSKEIATQLQFFSINVGKIAEARQSVFLEDEALQPYKHWLERRFTTAKHVLTEAEERILMLKAGPAYSQWVRMTDTFLSKEEAEVLQADGTKKVVGMEQILSLVSDDDKRVRDSAAQAAQEIFARHAEVAEAEMNAVLSNKKIDDELRGYQRADQSRHISDDIDSEVVDALVEAAEGFYKVSQRFYDLKASLLRQKSLSYSERAVGYGAAKQQYSFDESAKLIHEVFASVDQQFADIFSSMLTNGQIDVFPRKGKTGGAFCAHHLPHQPVYVLLNYTNKLRDVATIAHEMGHAINAELINNTQNTLNVGVPMSTAEVASTFMEGFVFDRLFAEADAETELALRVGLMNDQVATIHRQIACYQFETALHHEYRQTGYVAKEKINELFAASMSAYLGKHAEGTDNWWVYWSHIRNYFYVYSYAGGLLIAKAMQAKVREDKNFIEKVKIFLSAGRSKSPKDIFADLGIDITDKAFWQQGLLEIEQQLEETEALAKKLGKI